MELPGKVVVVTGGASGIGAALCHRFAAEGAAGIVVADIDEVGAQRVADEAGGLAVAADVSDPGDVAALVARTRDEVGEIDLLCSNAGIGAGAGALDATLEDWERSWHVNVMGHVHLVREALPAMLERGAGYVLGTVSAAGLLNHILSVPYGVTKAAALSFLEWLSIAHHEAGIRVSALCPQGVRTPMLEEAPGGGFLMDDAMEPAEVADAVVGGTAEERFLILPHPEVEEFFRRRADDHERWLRGMRRLRGQVVDLLEQVDGS